MTSEEQFDYWFAGGIEGVDQTSLHYRFAKKAWLEATRQAYERATNILNISRSDALLMAGEMTAQEGRTVTAVLTALQSKIQALLEVETFLLGGEKLPF